MTTIAELIARLEKLKKEHGNCFVVDKNDSCLDVTDIVHKDRTNTVVFIGVNFREVTA